MVRTAVPGSAPGSDKADGFLGLVTAIVKQRLKKFCTGSTTSDIEDKR